MLLVTVVYEYTMVLIAGLIVVGTWGESLWRKLLACVLFVMFCIYFQQRF